MIRVAAVAAAVLMLSGCDSDIHSQLFDLPKTSSARASEQLPDRPFEGAVVRHDDRRSVTCWVYTSEHRNGEAGISCLPDWMLSAPKGGMAVRP